MEKFLKSAGVEALWPRSGGAAGLIKVDGRAITVHDIRVPMFVVGTEQDDVAPWRSVHKFRFLCDSDINVYVDQ